MLPVHRQGLDNLARALPELSPAEVRRCARRMWRHLGRVAAEYPHLHRFSVDAPGGRVELVGRAHLDEAKRSATGGIFFSGHIGNWEIAALTLEQRRNPGNRRLQGGEQPDRRPHDLADQGCGHAAPRAQGP